MGKALFRSGRRARRLRGTGHSRDRDIPRRHSIHDLHHILCGGSDVMMAPTQVIAVDDPCAESGPSNTWVLHQHCGLEPCSCRTCVPAPRNSMERQQTTPLGRFSGRGCPKCSYGKRSPNGILTELELPIRNRARRRELLLSNHGHRCPGHLQSRRLMG